jgi:high-affinity K+ transport system ATPase subunit B
MTELHARFIPFSVQTRMSGVDLDGASISKGAVDAFLTQVRQATRGSHAPIPAKLNDVADRISRFGGTPLAVSKDDPRAHSFQRRGPKSASVSGLANCAPWALAPAPSFSWCS